MYHSQLGRFCSRDPIGYVGGESLYQYYYALSSVDPLGLLWVPPDQIWQDFDCPWIQTRWGSPWAYTHCGSVSISLKQSMYAVVGYSAWAKAEGWICRCCNAKTGEGGWAAGAKLKVGLEVGFGAGADLELWGFKFGLKATGPQTFHEWELASLTKRCDGASQLSIANYKTGMDFRIGLDFGNWLGLSGYVSGRLGAEFQVLTVVFGSTIETSYLETSAGAGLIDSKLKITEYLGVTQVSYERNFGSMMWRFHARHYFSPWQ